MSLHIPTLLSASQEREKKGSSRQTRVSLERLAPVIKVTRDRDRQMRDFVLQRLDDLLRARGLRNARGQPSDRGQGVREAPDVSEDGLHISLGAQVAQAGNQIRAHEALPAILNREKVVYAKTRTKTNL